METVLGVSGYACPRSVVHAQDMWLLCEQVLGLPHVANSQSQPVPADSPQDTAEPLSQDGGTSVKVRIRKGKKLLKSEGRSVREAVL